jgi:transposase-like protein
MFDAPDLQTARRILELVVQEFEALAPKAVERFVEQLSREIRRRERVVGIFPNEEAARRPLGAVLMEIDEAWATGHRHLDMAE